MNNAERQSARTLDIVLPCYNPPEGWTQKIIESWGALLQAIPDWNLRLIVVNDGSKVRVGEKEKQALARCIPQFLWVENEGNRGKGYALRNGIGHSDADLTLFTDIDFPYTHHSLLTIFRALESQTADVVVGIKDADYYSHLPRHRILISQWLRFLIRFMLRLPVTDTQCGLKGFNAKGRALFLQTTIDRYLADLEFIFLVSRSPEVGIQAIPVSLRPGVVFSPVRLNILWSEGMNFLKVFFKEIRS
jgi:cellulose synthase/poly-beta-1,6-N-acetylglucosamine synthase-like glycosyltransferase